MGIEISPAPGDVSESRQKSLLKSFLLAALLATLSVGAIIRGNGGAIYSYDQDAHGSRELIWVPDKGEPQTLWFMSFPESGVTYFMHLIHVTTGQRTATNFGNVEMNSEGVLYPVNEDSVPIYENGPIWLTDRLDKPEKYAVTRTHGTGYCLFCAPKGYFYGDFKWKAASGTKIRNGQRVPLHYNPYQVNRMIHLIRDPYDNIVARFYSFIGLMRVQKKFAAVDRYPLTGSGFQTWCKAQDDAFLKLDMYFIPKRVRKLAANVPCRQEFVKLVRFHNKAYFLAQRNDIDNIVIKYEDYVENTQETIRKVNNFAEYPTINDNPEIVMKLGKGMFNSHWTIDQKIKAGNFMKNIGKLLIFLVFVRNLIHTCLLTHNDIIIITSPILFLDFLQHIQ